MVSVQIVRASNAVLKDLQPGLVGLFVGATSGIGEYTLKQFYAATAKPRVYFVGRNEERAREIISDLEKLNGDGRVTFIKKDVTLIRNVDEVCNEIKKKETKLNFLMLSAGFLTLKGRTESSEGLDLGMTIQFYSRMRFIQQLMPLLNASGKNSELSRVVSVLSAGNEGNINLDDIDLKHNFSRMKAMGQVATMTALLMEEFAKENTTTSFIHAYPGFVNTNIMRRDELPLRIAGLFLNTLLRPWMVNPKESGERHLYAMTSAAYPPREGFKGIDIGKNDVVPGVDGKTGSGAYLLTWDGSTTGNMKVVNRYRAENAGSKIWKEVVSVMDAAVKVPSP